MDIRLCEYAIEIARQKSFTRAALELNIAQPSLSQQIQKLESELGTSLFFRGHGPALPTPDGERFLSYAEQILRLRDDLYREMHERGEGMSLTLTIGAPAITGGHLLPPLLQEFTAKYPMVRVQLLEETTAKLEELTSRGETDISILALPLEDVRLATRTILTEPLMAALPRFDVDWMTGPLRDALADPGADISLEALASTPFIVLKNGYGFRRTVLSLCAEAGFQPRLAFETSSIETAQSLVAHGLGVTLVPQMVMRTGGADAPRYRALTNAPSRTLVFAYRSERYLSKAARALMDLGRNNLQNSGPEAP